MSRDEQYAEGFLTDPAVVNLLAHAIRDARLAERRAITTFLREASFVAAPDVLTALADRIERGEHSS